ncbi:GNAT family N-acetyltransferase [Deinococcus pimensis]|uniref:GNAT family N-acetyltransferase n=1 Tax=Deinococcus pimensis TaxID=309888 RepID=UPI0004B77F54|nr:GNAT family N-acetyltransferase [Deinococcus pimensis]
MAIELLEIRDERQVSAALDLQRATFRVEAELIEWHDLPPLREGVADLPRGGETFQGWFERRRVPVVIARERALDVLDVHRVMVHPSLFRRGVARALLDFVEERELDAAR